MDGMYNGTSLQQLPAIFTAVEGSAVNIGPRLVLETFLQFFNFSTLWKALVLALLISNAKNLPLVYHVCLFHSEWTA